MQTPGDLVASDGVVDLRTVAWHPPESESAPPGYVLGIHLTGTDVRVGTLLLRIQSYEAIVQFVGHVAYEIEPEHRGHRYAARATALLGPLARKHGMRELWIMVSVDNFASMHTATLAGASFVSTADVPEESDMRALGIDRVHRFRLQVDALP